MAAFGHGRAVLLILLVLMGCAPIGAAPGPATYAHGSTDHDSGSPEHGGGDGGGGGM